MILHSNIIGRGKPMLILHGFLGMGDNWKTLGKQFSALGFQVHLIDQRNHGRSFHSKNFNYDVMANDLEVYCEFHELKAIILLGHSMGGKTAMMFAAQQPNLVSKLIVADIAPKFYPIHHDDILNGLSELNFDTLNTRKEADQILSAYVPDFGTRQFLLKNLYWVTPDCLGIRINLEVLKTHVAEVGEALPEQLSFEKATLFLRGDKSEYISTEDESSIRTQFPLSKIETISNAGHWLHAENPREFYSVVERFIA
jgi:pimeloyl-ACP methyl ester carboxylesterase